MELPDLRSHPAPASVLASAPDQSRSPQPAKPRYFCDGAKSIGSALRFLPAINPPSPPDTAKAERYDDFSGRSPSLVPAREPESWPRSVRQNPPLQSQRDESPGRS